MAVPLQDLKDDVERLVNKVGEWMNGGAQESATTHLTFTILNLPKVFPTMMFSI